MLKIKFYLKNLKTEIKMYVIIDVFIVTTYQETVGTSEFKVFNNTYRNYHSLISISEL